MKRYFKIGNDLNIYQLKNFPNQKKLRLGNNFPLVNYINIGYYILTPILFGVFLGLLLEKYFAAQGKFVLIFIILGTIASFFNIWKIYQKSRS